MKRMTMALGIFAAAGAAHGQWADDFNRPDGPIGPNWTETTGTWAILANQGKHTGTGVNTILTHNSASLGYANTIATLDVFRPGGGVTSNAFVALMVGLGGTDTIMVKVQAQSTTEDFGHIGIYHRVGTGWGAWTGGLPFGVLQAPFRAARLTVSFPDPDTLRLDVDTDFNGTADQTYLSPGVSAFAANLGTGHGVGAWLAAASFDNWSVSPVGATGACCLLDGSCTLTTATGCQAQGGIYRGDNSPCATANCPQPPTGACCVTAGCQILTAAQCTAANGTYRGDNTTCATANCPQPCPDIVGSIPDAPTTWPSSGGIQTTRLFRDGVPDTCALAAPGGAPLAGSFQYQKFDFVNTGGAACVTVDVNTACTGTNFIYAGAYLGAYNPATPSTNNVASVGGSPNPTAQMSFNVPAGATFSLVFAEVTANAGCPSYTFRVSGGQFNCNSGAPCYANCDGSTTAPILNVNDFICFQSAYAAGASYANCDNSTTPPVLNVNDFICFQSAYAAGCP